MAGHIHWWQDLASAEIAALDKRNLVAVLPLAAIEQHGAHLPLSTDLDINLGLLEAAFARLPIEVQAFALPPLCATDSVEHTAFAGTLSIGPMALIDSIRELGRSLQRSSVHRLVLFNSHGGNVEAAGIAALALRDELDMTVVRADYFLTPPPTGLLPDDEIRHGLHGGALETSLMLALRPEAVRHERIGEHQPPRSRHASPGAHSPVAWRSEDFAEDGIIGNPALASAAIGQALVEHHASALVDILVSTAGLDVPER